MKKKVIALSLAVLLNTSSFAIGGGVVTDPTSYTYYAQQIKAMNDQIKSALDQINILNEANQILTDANKLIFENGEKIFNPVTTIMNLANNLQGLKNRVEMMGKRLANMGIERFMKDYHNINEPLQDKDYVEFQKKIGELFSDHDDETYKHLKETVYKSMDNNNYEAYQIATANLSNYMTIKGIERDQLTKAALLTPVELYNYYYFNAEEVERREQKEQTIKDLIFQIESSQDMVKQQQTTSQILLELLDIAQAQYEMQMAFFNAVSLASLSDRKSTQHMSADEIELKKEELRGSSASSLVKLEEDDWEKRWDEKQKEYENIVSNKPSPSRFLR